jgi:hypothetical protein
MIGPRSGAGKPVLEQRISSRRFRRHGAGAGIMEAQRIGES